MNTSQILARALADRGVTLAFGMPGGVTLPILDAFREVGIEFVLVRDEASAGFMADAVWAVTGAPGVCLATLGPGATNLVSGVAGALLDRSAVVAITGQIAGEKLNVYTHQTLNQPALFEPIVKRSVTLTAQRAWQEIPLALRHLTLGRPGPVHLNIPGDVATAEQPGALTDRFIAAPSLIPPTPLVEIGERLDRAERPVILAGIGDLSDGAARALTGLAESAKIPVITTYKAKGLIPEGHAWSAGACGLSPAVDALQQALIERADLLIAVGLDPVELRPNWLPGWRDDLPVICVDRSPPHDLAAAPDWLLIGDVPWILQVLAQGGAGSSWAAEEVAAHRAEISALFAERGFGPAAAIRAVQAGLPGDAIVALDVGAHRITASHVWRCDRPRTVLQSNGFSSMGYGLPAAIAAKLACPDRTAVCLSGDMGLWMTLGELGIIQERGLDAVVVYLSDNALSLIELKQERAAYASSGVRFSNPDVEALGRAFGGRGVRVDSAQALTAAVREGVARGGLALIEAAIDPAAYRDQM